MQNSQIKERRSRAPSLAHVSIEEINHRTEIVYISNYYLFKSWQLWIKNGLDWHFGSKVISGLRDH